ncbi:DUF3575 domain-containing protein [Aequorivita sp. SDUM287046]|uniref:DUF3575 domain-containing protein n=1 Tax=Aequorivita aurantiaca TaxID=3053356 RepID=A0ABT8DJX6_9FLAO|nr:DUF3575 domain-containing protein [Aequorivita aurantiaca]MDN3723548.1 DUF3575 domain-containing protein [Aequorivita aurantiaca]
MKKLFLSVIFLLTLYSLNAQNPEEDLKAKNEIDLVISDLLDGAFQLKYERMLSKHFTANLGIGFKGENGIINLAGLDTDKIKTNGITYSGYKLVPEVRYYLNNSGQASMRGFYFGAYLKYSDYKSDLNGRYFTNSFEEYEIAFQADIKVTSIGLLVGYKLPVSKRWTVDFLIAGPGTGFYNFSIKNTKDLPDEFYEDLNQALENYHIFELLDGNFRFSASERKSNFNLLSLRYGISVGYSF